ncbi:hypothetical protein [Algoriphagus taiwanensis]|uniref:Uncharacterized protein n=1 Tax=Algoriphagus taiwanensis TaxID=1445656 RepID=A0ABQ6PZZ2_9BACT|nr:hypothetical protein Ataiwa_17690 [Algoriphagus taiwanensis]
MAKTNEQFDRVFREKLETHQEKPSALAWERLESQLPTKAKKGWGFFIGIAASMTILLTVGYLLWPREGGISEENLLAEQTTEEVENTPEATTEVIPEEVIPSEEKEEFPEVKSIETPAPKKQEKVQKQTEIQPRRELIADSSPKIEEQSKKTEIELVPVPELKAEDLIELPKPELKAVEMPKTLVAEASKPAEDEPLYRVSIYSNGIKKGEAPDKNLITELGKTVGQVEDLLGKVDDGLISLQDAKNNLFTAKNTKREVSEEKP